MALLLNFILLLDEVLKSVLIFTMICLLSAVIALGHHYESYYGDKIDCFTEEGLLILAGTLLLTLILRVTTLRSFNPFIQLLEYFRALKVRLIISTLLACDALVMFISIGLLTSRRTRQSLDATRIISESYNIQSFFSLRAGVHVSRYMSADGDPSRLH